MKESFYIGIIDVITRLSLSLLYCLSVKVY